MNAPVVLVGAGVVGVAIVEAHLAVGQSVTLLDIDPTAIGRAVTSLRSKFTGIDVQPTDTPQPDFHAVHLMVDTPGAKGICDLHVPPSHVIESISERLDVKQLFFAEAETWYPEPTVLCSNTSTLRISQVGASMADPSRLVGMHFFMPVAQRRGVEVIASTFTDPAATQSCIDLATRLGKQAFRVGDAAGFVVNRLLTPYLNEAMTMLCRGATDDQLRSAALAFGMPMSPLELVDWIGTRTAFDGGRTYWQAFPDRIRPTPLLSKLVKSGIAGKHTGCGFYRYDGGGNRERGLAPEVAGLIHRYSVDRRDWTTNEVQDCLAAVVWIESQCILRDGVAAGWSTIEMALAGGLAYGTKSNRTFADYLTIHEPADLLSRCQAIAGVDLRLPKGLAV